MSGTRKRVIINSRERVVSPDINRLQAFADSDAAEEARLVYEAAAFLGDNLDVYPGVTVPVETSTNPIAGHVLGGLMVRPQLASTSLLIDKGLAYVVEPDGTPDPDDNPYKYCRSAGVQTVGVLTLTAGAGSTRIDVIECARVTNVLETDSRDVFDPSTGIFTARTVDKVAAGQLQFRIRTGTPGAGFPGTVSGWMPLAVMSVPAAAANLDTCTLWDVRPLVNEQVNAPFFDSRIYSHVERQVLMCDEYANVAERRLSGVISSGLLSSKLGGQLTSDDGTSDLAYIDLLLAKHQQPGFTPLAGRPYYFYLAMPEGLPRWVKYSHASVGGAGRIPYGQRGIPIVAHVTPDKLGYPSVAVGLPSASGLGGSTTVAVCVAAGIVTTGPVLRGFMVDGSKTHFANSATSTFQTPISENASTATFRLIDGTTHPANARAVKVRISCTFHASGAGPFEYSRIVRMYDLAGGTNVVAQLYAPQEHGRQDAAGDIFEQFEIELPIRPMLIVGGGSFNRDFVVEWSPTGGTLTKTGATAGFQVTGWILGS